MAGLAPVREAFRGCGPTAVNYPSDQSLWEPLMPCALAAGAFRRQGMNHALRVCRHLTRVTWGGSGEAQSRKVGLSVWGAGVFVC